MTGVACFSLLLKFGFGTLGTSCLPPDLSKQCRAQLGEVPGAALPPACAAAADLSGVTPTPVLSKRGTPASSGVCSLPKIAAASHHRRWVDAKDRVSRALRAPRPVPARAERPQGHGAAARCWDEPSGPRHQGESRVCRTWGKGCQNREGTVVLRGNALGE